MKLYLKYFLKLNVFMFLISCTSDVDFDQIKNTEVNQRLTASFIYLSVDQNTFLNANGTSEINAFSSQNNFDILSSDYFKDYLVQTNFTFTIENSFDRSFEIEFSFLDYRNIITNTFTVNVPRNTNFTHVQNYQGVDLLSLLVAKELKLTMNLQPSSDSSILDKNIEMNFEVKSFANFIFKVD